MSNHRSLRLAAGVVLVNAVKRLIVRRAFAVTGAIMLAVLLPGCTFLEDNGTHLAYALEKGASKLRSSGERELVLRYQTLDGPAQAYYVEITPSLNPSSQRQDVWGSYIVVSGRTSGGTSYHNRVVFVPQRLYVEKKQGGPSEIVLRKDADRISVVEVR